MGCIVFINRGKNSSIYDITKMKRIGIIEEMRKDNVYFKEKPI